MYFWCASTTVWHRSTAARYASAGPSWRLGSAGVASSLIEPNFGGGHRDQRDAPTALDGRSMQLTNYVCWGRRRPNSRSGGSRERWLRRSDRDMACPSVCEPHNAPLSGHLNAGLLEHKTVVFVNSQHPVDAERPLLPSRAANLTVFLRFLVALPPCGVCCSSPNICSSLPASATGSALSAWLGNHFESAGLSKIFAVPDPQRMQ